MLAEAADRAKTSPELGIERRPADLHVPFQGVEPIGEPDIDVDDHGTRPDGPQCALADRHRVLAKGSKEVLVEQDTVLPEGRLIADDVGHGNFGLHEAAAALDLGARLVGKKG